MLEAFVQDVMRWPPPEAGLTLHLPALGSVYHVALPTGSQFQTDAATNAYIPSATNPNIAVSLLSKRRLTQPGRQTEAEPVSGVPVPERFPRRADRRVISAATCIDTHHPSHRHVPRSTPRSLAPVGVHAPCGPYPCHRPRSESQQRGCLAFTRSHPTYPLCRRFPTILSHPRLRLSRACDEEQATSGHSDRRDEPILPDCMLALAERVACRETCS